MTEQTGHRAKTIPIRLDHAQYDIQIGGGLLSQAGDLLRETIFAVRDQKSGRAFVITDENVAPLYLEGLTTALCNAEIKSHAITVPAGESSKSIGRLDAILEEMCREQADRSCCVIALGGGVVGDLAGFVAASYARGLAFMQVPTTLLSQVDSSVGGKVGVNLSLAKNMVGAFWQPRGVLIDIDALKTLPDREYRAGLAEVVKYGMILDEDFMHFMEQNTDAINKQKPETLIEMISRCCQLKAEVVQQDEREETGLRAVLNYGHTYAHAFEALAGYGVILHGEAVSMGMMCAARLAEKLGMIDPQIVARQHTLLKDLQIPIDPPQIDLHEFEKTILRDKKAADGKARFILPDRIGHVKIVSDINPQMAWESIQASVDTTP